MPVMVDERLLEEGSPNLLGEKPVGLVPVLRIMHCITHLERYSSRLHLPRTAGIHWVGARTWPWQLHKWGSHRNPRSVSLPRVDRQPPVATLHFFHPDEFLSTPHFLYAGFISFSTSRSLGHPHVACWSRIWGRYPCMKS